MSINRCGLTYTDKVVLITGGSKGIDAGCARVFVDAGAKVMICARGAEAGIEFARELSGRGPGVCSFETCDVAVESDIKRVIEQCVETFGRLDCLINNAGYHPPHKPIDGFSVQEFTDLLQVNLISYFIACKYALPHLRKTNGSVINMGSLVGAMGQEAATIYCATKGAITSFTKSLAIEEARFGVRVNAVLPGNIYTEGTDQFVANDPKGKEILSLVNSWQVTGRSGTSEECGQVCLFLAGEAASYLTGIELIVSGGSELGYGVKYPCSFLGAQSR